MQTALLIFHIVLAVIMIGLVLIQKSEGGALGMGGSGGGFMSARGSANLLTRTTAVLATLFFASTLGLALVFKGAQAPKSLLDTPAQAPISAPVETPMVPAPVSSVDSPVASVPAKLEEKAAPIKAEETNKKSKAKKSTSKGSVETKKTS